MFPSAELNALLFPSMTRCGEDAALGNIREITGKIEVAKSGIENPSGRIVSRSEKSSVKMFEFEDLISFCPMKPRAYVTLEEKDRLSESPGRSLSCELIDDAELVSTSMFMCNAEWNRSFAATVVFNAHVGFWGTSDSNPRWNVEDCRSLLRIDSDGKSYQQSAKANEKLGERCLGEDGCRVESCGEEVLIGMFCDTE